MNFPKGTIQLLRATVLAITAAWVPFAAATVLVIDDLTETPTISINGTPITITAGQTVGVFPNFQEVSAFGIDPNTPFHTETAIINFNDYSLPTIGPERSNTFLALFFSPIRMEVSVITLVLVT